ncbi:hypothetical protein [Sphingomonas yabuuchiae]|uniref:Uncharacterized protein n=2 Tax=Sphingomonas yabuuchiae TaxID=172044 RepID=A0ABR6K994_9SPHN|nr:hypothetical protein [Sphingomonas yabuuchiae]MBB4609132.1 hypothetical protein [Sphingomonas yabuuchiae]
MTVFALWMIAAVGASVFCLVRGVLDCRRGHYVWGVLGIASGLILAFMPIQTHAVKVDLPVEGQGPTPAPKPS